jgi:hypothetical protein
VRSKSEILEKAKCLLDGAREDFVQKRLSKHYRNCVHNECSVARSLGKFNYCKLKSQIKDDNAIEKLFICDSDEWSCKCEEFKCRNTKDSSEYFFREIIANPSRCGQLFPRLSALLWVLNDGRHKEVNLQSDCQNSVPHGHEKNEEKTNPGFWRRLIRRVSWGGK